MGVGTQSLTRASRPLRQLPIFTATDGIEGTAVGAVKKQREGFGLLIATTLQVRSANLMELSASLPREAQRIDMRDRWISRLPGNERIDTDRVMAPIASEFWPASRPTGRLMPDTRLGFGCGTNWPTKRAPGSRCLARIAVIQQSSVDCRSHSVRCRA